MTRAGHTLGEESERLAQAPPGGQHGAEVSPGLSGVAPPVRFDVVGVNLAPEESTEVEVVANAFHAG